MKYWVLHYWLDYIAWAWLELLQNDSFDSLLLVVVKGYLELYNHFCQFGFGFEFVFQTHLHKTVLSFKTGKVWLGLKVELERRVQLKKNIEFSCFSCSIDSNVGEFHDWYSLLTLLLAFNCERITWAWSTPPIPPPLLLACVKDQCLSVMRI